MATKGIEPDLILLNGRIATQDERRSFAQAVAIQDGRFAWGRAGEDGVHEDLDPVCTGAGSWDHGIRSAVESL